MTSSASLEERAASLARIAHDGQEDKAGRPYIEHPAAVVRLLGKMPEFQSLKREDQETARAAAWLHDVVEDTSVELQDLHVFGFPQAVISRVSLLTKTPEKDREAYCRAITIDPIALVVKWADNAHNSDPERLALLDPAARDRLDAKYGQDRAWLGRAGSWTRQPGTTGPATNPASPWRPMGARPASCADAGPPTRVGQTEQAAPAR